MSIVLKNAGFAVRCVAIASLLVFASCGKKADQQEEPSGGSGPEAAPRKDPDGAAQKKPSAEPEQPEEQEEPEAPKPPPISFKSALELDVWELVGDTGRAVKVGSMPDKNMSLRGDGRWYVVPRAEKLTPESMTNLVAELESAKIPGLSLAGRKEINQQSLAMIAQATPLRRLDLSQTSIGNDAVPLLLKMKELRALDLSETQVNSDGLRRLAALSGLQELDLSRTKIDGDALVQGGNMATLRTIRLRETDIDDAGLFNLTKWKSLVTVDLYGTKVRGTSLSALAPLPALRVLDLSRCPLVDTFEIDTLTQLHELELNFTGIGSNGLARVAALTKLKVIGLNHTKVTDEALAHLKPLSSLETLRLEGTAVTDAGLKHLEALAALKHLYLGSIKVSAEAKAALTVTRPGLTLHH